MDEAVIWTAQELVSFTRHEEDGVREWALGRLAQHHRAEAGNLAVSGLADPSWSCVGHALEVLDASPVEGAQAALEALQRRRDLPAALAARAEALLRGEPAPARLDEPVDAALEALAASPAELRRRAPEMLASGTEDDRVTALLALERQPYRWAAEIVLERLDALLASDLYTLAWDTLVELGDPAALPAALAAWRPGDWHVASVAVRLHQLACAGTSQPALPEALLRDAEVSARKLDEVQERLRAGLDLELPAGELRLGLRCTRCRQVHEYDVQRAWINPEKARHRREGWDGVLLGRIVICKACGAEDEYELTSTADTRLSTHLLLARAQRGAGPASSPVTVGVSTLWDGTLCKRPTPALRHLRALAEREPTRGEAWRRLGNLSELYDRMDEAVAAWTRAIADEDELEACYSLAKHHAERGRAQEAFDFAVKTIARARGGPKGHPAEMRRAAADEAFVIIGSTLPHAREPLALAVTWSQPSVRGDQPAVALSSVDLRRVGNWDRLVELFASDAFIAARLSPELPEEPGTILERLLASDAPIDGAVQGRRLGRAQAPAVRSAPKVGRNEPCSCGSGKKLKRCCGR